ncbi:MAG: hypothetical protein LBI48_11065 [Burkholderiaceae bacterium]|jgi:hypothetical protein|nr:hypothetical protein [Burkholderiaceae bacterium]
MTNVFAPGSRSAMKYLALAVLLAALSVPVTAAHATQKTRPAATAKTANSAKKPAAQKTAAKPKKAAKETAKETGQVPAPKAAAASAASTEILTPDELETARHIYVGNIACELGAHLLLAPDAAHPGFFSVTLGKRTFYMHPVHSRTGAVRMEDDQHAAVFLQLGSKSMLMDQKAGQRMADECQSPEQAAFAARMKENPPPSLLSSNAPEKRAIYPCWNWTRTRFCLKTTASAAGACCRPHYSFSGEKNAESLP